MNITNNEDRKIRTDTFIGVFIALVIFFIALRIPFDTDFFWHLNAGKVMNHQQSILLTDLFSFTRYNEHWTNHSWLSQILFYLTYKFSGYMGLMIFVAIVTTATMLLIYKSMVGKSILKAFLIVFAVLISAVVWSPRPQIFSILCFAVLYQFIVNYDKTSNRKYLFFIGFLFLIWSNLHAGFSLGILFVFLFILGKFIDLIVDYEKYKIEKIKIKWLVILLAVCIIIVCINPNGINTWKVQFDTVSIGTLQNQIDEWASPDFHKVEQQPYLWIWMLFALFLGVTSYKFRFQEILPILAFGGLGFIAKRNYALFAIVVFPSLSKIIVSFFEIEMRNSYFFRNWKSSVEKFNVIPKPIFQKAVNYCFIFLAGLAIFLKIIYLGNELVLTTYEKKLYPAEAISFLEKNSIPDGNLLNSYAWGGYINWKNPNLLVFVDGRTDLFGDEILGDWSKLVKSESGYQDLLLKYDIGWVFIEKDLPIVQTLINNQWQVYYSDNIAIILSQ
jgi:hypothetical protein